MDFVSDWVQVRDWFLVVSAGLAVTALWALAWSGR